MSASRRPMRARLRGLAGCSWSICSALRSAKTCSRRCGASPEWNTAARQHVSPQIVRSSKMAEIRETQVTQDMEGNVVDRKTVIERPRKKKGGFSLGLLIGVLIVAGAIVAFAYNQGSFQSAGREADQATQTAQVQLDRTTQNTQQAINNARSDNSSTEPAQQPTQTN